MKKKLLKMTSLALSVLMLSTQMLFAAPALSSVEVADEDIAFNEEAFEAEFAELNNLEEAVLSNEVASIEEAAEMGYNMDNFNNLNAIASAQGFSFDNMDWVSFAWGFFCCPVGFFVVAINKDKSSDEKTSFWIGAIISSVIGSVRAATYSY